MVVILIRSTGVFGRTGGHGGGGGGGGSTSITSLPAAVGLVFGHTDGELIWKVKEIR